LIASGQVLVNGRPASAGQQIRTDVDEVTIEGRRVELPTTWSYLMMNKPVGVLTSVGDPRGRPSVTDGLPADRRLFPVGRLDLDSRGLLLLTDDGELAMRLMHPRYGVEKEYRVLVVGHPSEDDVARLGAGMTVKGERFQPALVRILEAMPGQTRLVMVLREGRKREVRRLWQALGHPVLDLQRVRIDGVELGDLEEGTVRPLTDDEIARLKGAVS
jgi:23S rRNA pseudouridine2605 synthase